jgi:hypothetical protein
VRSEKEDFVIFLFKTLQNNLHQLSEDRNRTSTVFVGKFSSIYFHFRRKTLADSSHYFPIGFEGKIIEKDFIEKLDRDGWSYS